MSSKERKNTEDKLITLTNEFLRKFFDIANEEHGDDLFNFNFLLPEILVKSDIPMYDKKDQHTLLMGMASFDDAVAKVFFNKRLQGFVKLIEEKMAYDGEQDDYYLMNIKTKDYLKDEY